MGEGWYLLGRMDGHNPAVPASTSKLPQWVLVGISIGFAMIGLERRERRTLTEIDLQHRPDHVSRSLRRCS